MKLTEILNIMKFNKQDIWKVFVATLAVVILVCSTIGFETPSKQKVSSILIIIVVAVLLIYCIITFCSYHMLPKNRSKDMVGVLFLIDTHNNQSDFNALKNKLVKNFDETAQSIKRNCLNPIILSLKNLEVYNKYSDRKVQNRLLEKTKCDFIVILKATAIGEDTSKYELSTRAKIKSLKLDEHFHKLLENNFEFVLTNIKVQNIDKKDDLKPLKDTSKQLFYICQYIFALANVYSNFEDYAIDLLKDLLNELETLNDSFYKKLKNIIKFQICNATSNLVYRQYCNYLYNKTFENEKVYKYLSDLCKYSKQIKNDGYIINYHLGKSIYNLIANNSIQEAESEIDLLDRYYPKFNARDKNWNYSRAFLFACKNNSKEFDKIEDFYKRITKDVVQDTLNIYNFILRYLQDNPKNTGIKIALFWLVYYKNDLNKGLIDDGLVEEITMELNKENNISLANKISKCYLEMKNNQC